MVKGTSNCQDTLRSVICLYNLRLVTITVTSEQLSIHDKFYMKDDTVKIPLWLAKLYYKENHCTIKDFEELEGVLNTVISNQQLSKNNLVPIEQDFYLMINDYLDFYIKYKLKYLELNDSLTENEKSEKEEEIRSIVKKQRNGFKKLVTTRKKILLDNCNLGYNRSLIKNMSFEESIMYCNICNILENFNDSFSYKL